MSQHRVASAENQNESDVLYVLLAFAPLYHHDWTDQHGRSIQAARATRSDRQSLPPPLFRLSADCSPSPHLFFFFISVSVAVDSIARMTRGPCSPHTQVNMNAGPSPLPQDALLTAAASLLSFDGSPGMGIAEISHRSKPFARVFDQANADLRKLLNVPDNYKILWMQGGGLTQFAATVLNLVAWYRTKHQLKPDDRVEGWYAVTGSWSKKAADEAARLGVDVRKVVDGKTVGGGKFRSIPPANEWDLPQLEEDQRKPAFIYYCDNETVDGIEFAGNDSDSNSGSAFPFSQVDPAIPIVCDMSSNFLSRPVDVSKYGIIYAGAQKNLGPAGVTLVIVRDDLLGKPSSSLPFDTGHKN